MSGEISNCIDSWWTTIFKYDLTFQTELEPLLLTNCVIKGYHEFHIRPPVTDPPTLLKVDREYTNIHDRNACLVWIPEKDSFTKAELESYTDEKRFLMLKDVAGLPVGHVPRTMAGAFTNIIEAGGSIYAQATGSPIESFPPWPAVHEKGGGIVIPCTYIIDHSDKAFVCKCLEQALLEMPEFDVIAIN